MNKDKQIPFEYKFREGRLFTGRHDSGGREIYDGDSVIVTAECCGVKNEYGEVYYFPDKAGFIVALADSENRQFKYVPLYAFEWVEVL